jgi:hypothetical protein
MLENGTMWLTPPNNGPFSGAPFVGAVIRGLLSKTRSKTTALQDNCPLVAQLVAFRQVSDAYSLNQPSTF